jgi:hypothetical protein
MSRLHYPECRVEVAESETREAFECDDAEVWIEEKSILISYFDDEGIVVLEGRPDEASGWTLSARSRPRQAFLKPMTDSPGSYIGEINEQGEVAGWRLRLGLPDSV